MAALVRHVALISETDRVQFADLTQLSSALQKQVTRDFGPIWDVMATVDVFEKLEDIPVGYWPIIFRDNIGQDGAGGFHSDDHGQPFALVLATDDKSTWQIAASHECLEMLADPSGNHLVPGDSPKPDQSRVEFLLEVCDPSEGAQFGYNVNGVMLSDFYTPHFFDPVVSSGVRYSFAGHISAPRQVLENGYLSWHDIESNHWWQLFVLPGGGNRFVDIGELSTNNGSIRAQLDRHSASHTEEALASAKDVGDKVGLQLAAMRPATNARAERLRATIDKIVKESDHPVREAPGRRRR